MVIKHKSPPFSELLVLPRIPTLASTRGFENLTCNLSMPYFTYRVKIVKCFFVYLLLFVFFVDFVSFLTFVAFFTTIFTTIKTPYCCISMTYNDNPGL